MRVAFISMTLCGLTLGGSVAATAAEAQDQAKPAAAAPADCKLRQITSLDMSVGPDGIMVPVSINGATKNFKLDLATSATFVAQETVDELKLPVTDLKKPAFYNAKQVKQSATMAKFQIGLLSVDNQTISVVPKDTLKAGTAGTLGAGLMDNMDFELDFVKKKLNLFSADHCPGQVVYWTSGAAAQIPYEHDPVGHLVIAMTLDDKPIAAGITGNVATLMPMGAMSKLFDNINTDSPGMTKVAATDVGLDDTPQNIAYNYRFKALSASGVTVSNPQLVVYGLRQSYNCNTRGKDAMEHCIGQPDVWLGVPTLSKFHLYFSSKENMIYLTGADAH